MTSMSLEDENRTLRILVEGCSRHPGYRARRRPGVGGCDVCDSMYDAARKLAAHESAKADGRA